MKVKARGEPLFTIEVTHDGGWIELRQNASSEEKIHIVSVRQAQDLIDAIQLVAIDRRWNLPNRKYKPQVDPK